MSFTITIEPNYFGGTINAPGFHQLTGAELPDADA
jgi:hypothetical protein